MNISVQNILKAKSHATILSTIICRGQIHKHDRLYPVGRISLTHKIPNCNMSHFYRVPATVG